MKNKKETQKQKVLNHLEQYGSITPLDALNLYGAFRLSAIIYDLRHLDGYDIKTDLSKTTHNYAIYSLKS